MVTLATERLLLRPFRRSDAAEFTRLAGDWAVASMTSDIPYPLTQTQAMAWLKPGRGEVRFAIELEGRLIGGAGYYRRRSGAAELGFWLGRPWWGRGYATEATQRHRPLRLSCAQGAGLHLLALRRQLGVGRRAAQARLRARRPRLYHQRRARPRRRGRHLLAERPAGHARAAAAHEGRAPGGAAGAPGSADLPAAARPDPCPRHRGLEACIVHEISRPGQDLHRLRRGRQRLHLLPAREVHRVRRSRRRRRRQGRRRVGRMRRQPQHADRLPLPPALQGQERPGRHGPEPLRRFRRGRGGCRAAGHAGVRRGPGNAAGRGA